ncbi:MAG: RHS repeat-associated core domain-containing protein, partial [Candidatus Sulfotelmatobacter sp.]
NQIQISYLAGTGSSSANTSARINVISDSRASSAYQFSYSSQCSQGQCFAHLSSISNTIGTPENYTFAYAANQSLVSPFNSSSYGTWAFLQSVTVTGLGIAHQFQYDGSGEMTQLTTPLGGVLQWTYRSFQYGTGVSLREVQYRYVPMLAGTEWYFWGNDSYDETQPFHYWTAIADTQAQAYKQWVFYANSYWYSVPSGADMVALVWRYQEWGATNFATLLKLYAYAIDSLGQPYTSQVTTYPDFGPIGGGPTGLPYTVTNQTLDIYGNLTQMQVYDYGNTSQTPTRTYNFTYITNSSYTSLYIRNRLLSATVTTSAGNTTLISNTYDSAALQAVTTPLHDSNYGTSFTTRGNVTTSVNLGTSKSQSYYVTGAVYQTQDAMGNTVTVSPASSSNNVLPGVVTPNSNSSLATSLSYASSFAATSVTGPNGAASSTTYDAYGRPQSSTIPDGAVTNYTYAYYTSGGQNSQTATVNNGVANQWKETILDGFGRTTSVLTGNGSTTVSEADTQYAPCACSPLGKVSAVSMPYAPGGTPVWTRYSYDSSGRTVTIVKPDGASTTTYAYAANQTTVTDPTGKWKTFTSDAFGNLLTVTEPDPSSNNGGTVATNYTYNSVNQLTQVSMPRAGTTQTRTFQWSGTDLTSATNPENGTVTYTYDGAHHVLTRTDAKQMRTQYSYDIYGRLLVAQHGTWSGGQFTPDPTQLVQYYWDQDPQAYFYGTYGFPSTNTAGRLAGVSFANSTVSWNESTAPYQLFYMFGYNQAGRVIAQDLRLLSVYSGGSWGNDIYASYNWDNLGRMTRMNYPLNGPKNTMTYDAMSNLTSVNQAPCQTWNAAYLFCNTWGTPATLASASYNLVGQLTGLNYSGGFGQETRGYNSMLQLTSIASPQVNMTYTYSATQNNGLIVSSSDAVTGENVGYTYDSLNRLIAAATTGTTGVQWGDSYSYDGFGNLTSKVVTKGTAPQVYPQFNSATNQEWTANDNGFDANGNWLGPGPSNPYTWNVENQLVSEGYVDASGNRISYTYDPWGQRVLQFAQFQAAAPTTCSVDFYSITGQRLGTYTCHYMQYGVPLGYTQVSINQFFGSRRLVAMDRLGSVRYNQNGSIAYFSWGEERTTTANGTDKFGTYFRDSSNGFDYARARYYNSNFGRFLSPDPAGSAHSADPQTWNRYSYAGGDPVNRGDPTGLDTIIVQRPTSCTVYAADNTTCLVSAPIPFPVCWSNTSISEEPVWDCFGEGSGLNNPPPPPRPDPCPGIAQLIWNTIAGTGMPGNKSLLTRVVQQITGSPSQFDGHQEEIDTYRNRLKNLRRQWQNHDCDDPDDPPYGTNQWIDETAPGLLRQYNLENQQFLNDLTSLASGAGSIVVLMQAELLFGSIAEYIGSLGGSRELIFAAL